jgi:hypothetical protein
MESTGIGILAFILLAGGGVIAAVACLGVDRTLRAGRSK